MNLYTVANSIIPFVEINPYKTIYDVGDNVTLSCSVTYPNSSLNDVNITMRVNIEWKYKNNTLLSYTAFNNYSQFTLHYHINSTQLFDVGEYTCYSFISTQQYHPFILNSSVTSQSIQLIIEGKQCI